MARRGTTEINASTMADIAFLLLVFFLVTTTMDTDTAIEQILPQKNDEPSDIIVKKRNVFEVKANMFDRLLVEGDPLELSLLKERTMEFLTNTQNKKDLPQMTTTTLAVCDQNIATMEAALKANPNNYTAQDELKKWEKRLAAVQLIGDYQQLPDAAVISLQNDNNTSYDMYIQVQNELHAAINELRDELCQEKFGVNYSDLNPSKEEDKPKIRAIRQVYPQRISEAQPKDNG